MELERDAASAVQALAAARTPDEGAAERAWALMQVRLVDGPPPIDIGATSSPGSPRARWFATGIAVAALLVLAVGLASWSAGWLAGVDARAPAEAPYSTTREDTAPETAYERASDSAPRGEAESPAIAPTPAPVDDVDATPVAPVASVAPAEPRTAKPSKSSRRGATEPEPEPSTSIPKTTTLAAEMRLLARANAAMRAGDAEGALAVLDEHARDFAGGQLAPEREYKRALALCELGRADKARAVASAFVKAHPRSPLRAKAQSVCREEDPQ